jgi:hypothetical protein
MPEVDEGRQPSFVIRLAPWAAATASELHQQFGGDVELTVGALPYPPGRQPPRPPAAGPAPDLLDPHEIAAELDGAAVVGSGHNLLHGLLLRNLTGRELQLATNGQITAAVVDRHTGKVVGGFSGFENRPLIMFKVAPGQRLGNLRHAHPRPAYPRPAPQAHADPAPHHHRLNHRRRRADYQKPRPSCR